MSTLFVNTITPNSGDTVTVSGSLTTTGKLTIGDQSSDTVAVTAQITSSLIPDLNNTFDLGSPSQQWNNVHASTVDSTTVSASNLVVTILSGTSGHVGVSGDATFTDDVIINDDLLVRGTLSGSLANLTGTISASTASIGLISSSLIPNANNTYDLGTMANSWGSAHIHGLGHIHTASINRLTVVNNVSGNLIPDSHDTYNLGSVTKQWNALYSDFISGSRVKASTSITAVTVIGTIAGEFGILTATESVVNTMNSSNTASFNVMSASKVIGDLIPMHDNASDLGSVSKEWKDLYVDGTANIDNADITSLEVGTISASALPTSKASASPGEFYTLSGSQIPLSGSTAQLNLFSASLFVFQRE